MNFGGLTTSAFSDRLSLVLILIIGLGIGTLILEAALYWFFSKVLKTTHALAFTLLAPAVIAGGGAPAPGRHQNNSSGTSAAAASKPADDRNWWQIKTDSDQQGWVPETVNDKPALTRQPILYSLDYGLQNFRDVFFDVDAKTGQITGWGRLLRTEGSTFPVLLARTALWTVLNVILHL